MRMLTALNGPTLSRKNVNCGRYMTCFRGERLYGEVKAESRKQKACPCVMQVSREKMYIPYSPMTPSS